MLWLQELPPFCYRSYAHLQRKKQLQQSGCTSAFILNKFKKYSNIHIFYQITHHQILLSSKKQNILVAIIKSSYNAAFLHLKKHSNIRWTSNQHSQIHTREQCLSSMVFLCLPKCSSIFQILAALCHGYFRNTANRNVSFKDTFCLQSHHFAVLWKHNWRTPSPVKDRISR